jgi:arsenate reductase
VILFLGVANSARSQIAEAIARARFGDRIAVASAGTAPSGVVHPHAIAMLARANLDISTARSKRLDELDPTKVELVVTLCAEEVRPAGLAGVRRLHWPLADPAVERPDDVPSQFPREQFLAAWRQAPFRGVRLFVEKQLDAIEPMLRTPQGTCLGPAIAEDRAEIEALLQAAGLPIDGLDTLGARRQFPEGFAVARLDGELVGAACVEWWGQHSLLRSVVVAPAHRGTHVGDALVADRVGYARQNGVEELHLLTLDKAPYFARLGFQQRDRATLPDPLSNSTQLALPACSTAIAMTKKLIERTTDDMLDDAIEKELAERGTLVPPWLKYPDIPRRSIGWRMGSGEWYLWMWRRWWDRQDAAARAAYTERYESDCPRAWRDWLRQGQVSQTAG